MFVGRCTSLAGAGMLLRLLGCCCSNAVAAITDCFLQLCVQILALISATRLKQRQLESIPIEPQKIKSWLHCAYYA